MLALADHADLDDGPRTKSGAARMCAVTRQVKPVDELIRFVVAPSGAVIADLKRKLPGRGLWLSLSRAVVDEAVRRGVFPRGFKKAVQVSPALAADTEALLVRSAMDALAMAGKAGQVVSGFAKTESVLVAGETAALIHAADGSDDGIRKLDAKLAALTRENPEKPADLPVIRAFTTDELDLALGRSNVVHAALLAGPASKTFLARCQTLDRFRQAAGNRPGAKGGRPTGA
ncbi:RNA-binding protein [Afipia sp. TerB]